MNWQFKCHICKPLGKREMLTTWLLYMPSNVLITFQTFTHLVLTITLFVSLAIIMLRTPEPQNK